MVAIRGCNTFREKTKLSKNEVVSEKTLMKNVHMFYIRVTEGKIEKMKKEDKNEDWSLNFHLHNTLCLPESVHKIS